MERRKTPRTSIRKLAYVNFEPYNTGGVITDVSAAGLRFHTVTPMQQGGVVRFSLTLGAANQIEAVGELVWTDSTRTIGGVRFVVLPTAAAEQIENWARANAGEAAAKSESDVAARGSALSDGSSEFAKTLVVESVGVPDNHDAPAATIPVQSVPAQTPPSPEANPNARTAWVPPSARPYAAASSIGPQSSSQTPKGSTLPPHGFGLPGQPNTMPWITHFDPDPPQQSAFTRGVIGGVIVCLLVAALAWFGLRRSASQGSSLSPANPALSTSASAQPSATPAHSALPAPDLPASADANSAPPNPDSKPATAANPAVTEQSGPSQAPSAPPAPKSSANPAAAAVAQSSQSSPADAKPAAKPEAARPGGNEQAQLPDQSPAARSPILSNGPRDIAPDSLALASQHAAKTPPAEAAPDPGDTGETQLILAWQYLEGQGGKPRDPTAASQLLWSAVQKGNLTAETTLANLYLRGEGVPKNCVQARVLLSAASDKGNAEAKRKLAELSQTGCR